MANQWQGGYDAGQSSGWSRQQWGQWQDNGSDTSMQNEWDGGWVVPETLEEADMMMRTRTTKPTPIEYDKMVEAMAPLTYHQPM